MSNECRLVITLHALTEIRRILQIEENIYITSVYRHLGTNSKRLDYQGEII